MVTSLAGFFLVKIKMIKYNPLIGSANTIRTALGIAPINGPKNGIIFVTPTITLTSNVYGIFRKLKHTKHRK